MTKAERTALKIRLASKSDDSNGSALGQLGFDSKQRRHLAWLLILRLGLESLVLLRYTCAQILANYSLPSLRRHPKLGQPAMVAIHPIALIISLLFSSHGYRKGSLNKSGAIAAGLVGYASLANQIKRVLLSSSVCRHGLVLMSRTVFGILLLSFYLVGSRATKVCLIASGADH